MQTFGLKIQKLYKQEYCKEHMYNLLKLANTKSVKEKQKSTGNWSHCASLFSPAETQNALDISYISELLVKTRSVKTLCYSDASLQTILETSLNILTL